MKSSAFLQLGNLFLKNNQAGKAAKMFKLYIEDFPEDFRGYFNLGKALSSQRDVECDLIAEAVANFEKALSLNPDIVDAHVSIAALYIKNAKPQLAVSHCQVGLTIDSQDTNCLFNLNIALRQLDRLTDAIELSRSYISSLRFSPLVQDCSSIRIPGVGTTGHVFSRSHSAERSTSSDSVSVVILKWGTKYGQDYVHALVAALKRHLSSHIIYNIICFTDDIDSTVSSSDGNIEYRLLPDLSTENWRGWWYKAYLFSQDSGLSGPVLYFDLDTILCSSVDFLAQEVLSSIHILCTPSTPPPQKEFSNALLTTSSDFVTTVSCGDDSVRSDFDKFFACLKASEISNEGRSCGLNSSIMLWNATPLTSTSLSCNYLHYLYVYLRENFIEISKVMYKFDHFLEIMLADRKGIFNGVCLLQNKFPNKIVDFQTADAMFDGDVSGEGEIDGDYSAAVVCFPLHPKPHDISDKVWVKRFWQTIQQEVRDGFVTCDSEI
mmetsp:Transcript_11499/g.18774  ORF Transcript_11499/g.18774 Transcript_11499/m.18774 type:complete len:492 (-) Transcript_11499:171-1646(-)